MNLKKEEAIGTPKRHTGSIINLAQEVEKMRLVNTGYADKEALAAAAKNPSSIFKVERGGNKEAPQAYI